MRQQAGSPVGPSAPGSAVRAQLSRGVRTKKQTKKSSKGKGKKGGRPVGTVKPILVSAQDIQDAAEEGCTNEEISILAGLGNDALQRRFKSYIALGRAIRKRTIRQTQYRELKAGSGTMLVWLGKNELGQKDRQEDDVEFHYDLNNLSREELERFAAGQPIKKILAGRERTPT